MQSPCPSYLDSRSQVKVKVFTLELGARSISPEPLGRFSINFTQMFLSVRRCAEFMTWQHRLKIKITLQGHVIYPSFRVRSISPEYFERFSFNFTQMYLSMRRCTEPMPQLSRFKVTDQPLNFVSAPYLLNP